MRTDITVVETSPNGRYVRYTSILGKGAYKTVYNAFDNDDALDVAWNKLHVDRLTARELEKVENEVKLLRQVEHKNIIRFYDSWRGDDNSGTRTINFITEKMVSGTLTNFLKKAKAIKLKVVRRWCWNILEAIAYLHRQNPPIMHRDLKCDNIFYNGHNGELKIGDLGLSGVKARERADSVIGTPEFMAPELYEESYTEKVDIYAFGMCLLEIVTMEYPYSECNNIHQIWKKLQNGEKPQAFHKLIDDDVKQVIAVCLDHESRRPSAIDLLDHPLFRDWEQDSGTISNLSLVKNSPNSVTAEHSSSSRNSNGLPMGANMIDFSDQLKRHLLVKVVEGKEREGDDEQEVSVVATNDKIGGFKIGLVIPIRDATKRVEFTFDPFIDSPQHIAQEMVTEFGLSDEQISVIQEEVERQVTKAKQQREDASRNATPQPIPREANADLTSAPESRGEVSRQQIQQSSVSRPPPEPTMQQHQQSISPQEVERALAPQLAGSSQAEAQPTYESDQQLSQGDGHLSERSVPSSQDFTQVQVPSASLSPSASQSHYQAPPSNIPDTYGQTFHTDDHGPDNHHQQILDAHADQAHVNQSTHQHTSYNGSRDHPRQYSETGSEIISPHPHHNPPNLVSQMPSRRSFPGAPSTVNRSNSDPIDRGNNHEQMFNQELHTDHGHVIPQTIHHGKISHHELNQSQHVSRPEETPYITRNEHSHFNHSGTPREGRLDTSPDQVFLEGMPGHFHQSVSDGQLPLPGINQHLELPKRPPSTPANLINSMNRTANEERISGTTLVPVKITTDTDGCPTDRNIPGTSNDPYFSNVSSHTRGSSVRSQDGGITSSRTTSNSMPTIVVVGNEPVIPSDENHVRASDLSTISLPDYSKSNALNEMYRVGGGEELSRSSSRHKLYSPERQDANADRDQANGLNPSRGRVSSQQRRSPEKSAEHSFKSSHSEYGSITQIAQNQYRDLYGDVNDRIHYTMCLKLMNLCAKGKIDEVIGKIQKGASVTFIDYDKRTPLHLAASEGHASVCKLLLENGAEVNAKDRWGNTPLTDAVSNGHVEVEALLRSSGTQDADTGSSEVTSLELMQFAATGNLEGVREMIVSGALPGYQDYDQRTPLHLACSGGHTEVTELLLVNGASFTVRDRMGNSPVDDAIMNGHKRVLGILRQYGATIPRHLYDAKPELRDQKGMDLVEHAAKGRVDAVARYLREGASANYGDYDNRTALHLACAEGRLDVVRVLLQAGANMHARDRWGNTPIDEAIKNGYDDITQELRRWEEKHEPHHQTSVSFDHNTTILNGYEGSGRALKPEPDLVDFHPLPHELASSFSMGAISAMLSSDAFAAKYPPTVNISFVTGENSVPSSQPQTPYDQSDDGSSKVYENEERLLQERYNAEKQKLEESHRKALEGLHRKIPVDPIRSGIGGQVEAGGNYATMKHVPILAIDPKPYSTEMNRNEGERVSSLPSPAPDESFTARSQPIGNEVSHINMEDIIDSTLQSPASRGITENRHTHGTTDAAVQTDEEDLDSNNVVPHIRRMLDGILDSVVSSDG